MDSKTIIALIAAIISLTSLAIVIYKEFLASFSLSTAINSVTFLRIPGINKSNLVVEILLDDLLSTHPSQDALSIIGSHSGIQNVLNSNRNRDQLKGIISTPPFDVNYAVPNNLLQNYSGNNLLPLILYIPINIYNSGKKQTNISTLNLLIQDINNANRQWTYTCLMEIDPEKILKHKTTDPDADIMDKQFCGINIGSSENVRVDCVFIPYLHTEKRTIATNPPGIGEYTFTIFGCNESKGIVLESNPVKCGVTLDDFSKMLTGTNINVLLATNRDIDLLIERKKQETKKA